MKVAIYVNLLTRPEEDTFDSIVKFVERNKIQAEAIKDLREAGWELEYDESDKDYHGYALTQEFEGNDEATFVDALDTARHNTKIRGYYIEGYTEHGLAFDGEL